MNLAAEQKKRTEDINLFLPDYYPEESGLEKTLCEAMNYSVRVGGKRLRPMILLESCKRFGGAVEEAKPFAAALEMIHTYSLVHDDLPAMDNDQYRRGNLTTHAKYGEAMGVLAGDGLLNYAFEVMSDAVLASSQPTRAALAMSIIAKKAGVRGMIAGQTVDLEMTGKSVTAEVLDYINIRKTSALLEASLMAGAALAGVSEETLKGLEAIGTSIGLAFQIKDDILDVIADEKLLGKPVHSDEKNEKNTYVSLLGIEKCEAVVLELTQKAVDRLQELPGENEFLSELLLSLAGRTF